MSMTLRGTSVLATASTVPAPSVWLGAGACVLAYVLYKVFKMVSSKTTPKQAPCDNSEPANIQALGRATFNGSSVLKPNGHSKVTILTNENDLLLANKYNAFLQAMYSQLSNNPGMNTTEAYKATWQEHCSLDAFVSFEQEPRLERYYRMVLERINEDRCDGGIRKVPEQVYEDAASITIRDLSKELVEQCREKITLYEVALKCHKALMHPTDNPHATTHLVSGKTRSGKTAVIAVCAAVHTQLNCFLIIITKGVAERDYLKIKLNKLLSGCRKTTGAGLLVISDSRCQIAKATKSVLELRKDMPHARFGVIVDEADVMYRTVDGAQIMEHQSAALLELNPSFRMESSAILANDEQGNGVKMMEVSTKDYSGINEMEHLQDSTHSFPDGKDFLRHTSRKTGPTRKLNLF